jgi:hypothetical protein
VDVPLELLRPSARLQQDRELTDRTRQRVAKPDEVPQALGIQHQLWAAAERHARAEDRLLSIRFEFSGGFLLSVGEFLPRDRRKPILGGGVSIHDRRLRNSSQPRRTPDARPGL